VRAFVEAAAIVLMLGRVAYADPPAPSSTELYERQKKSVALAVTLEALCPIAGAGAFYAGESDKGTALAIISTVAAGAVIGSTFWLIHLDDEQTSGASSVVSGVEQGIAVSLIVTGAIVYVVARISGLSLAPEATNAFNLDLQQRLGAPVDLGPLPVHALAPLPGFTLRF
jgi:hypothetical protein